MNELVAVLLALSCLVVAVIWRRRVLQANQPPSVTSVARDRLETEIESLRERLAAAPVAGDPVAQAVWKAQQTWYHEQLAAIPVETLKTDGIGPGAFQALRNNGMRTFADLPRLDHVHVPGLGDQKREALLRVYNAHRLELERKAKSLRDDELDRISGGGIERLRTQVSTRQRKRMRETEALTIQLRELERRLDSLHRHTSRGPDARVFSDTGRRHSAQREMR